MGVREQSLEWTVSYLVLLVALAPLAAPSTINMIRLLTILLLPHLSLQEEGHLHPTELSPLTESPESATWAAEPEEGDVGREVETRTGSEEGSIDLLTMIFMKVVTMEVIKMVCFLSCNHIIQIHLQNKFYI